MKIPIVLIFLIMSYKLLAQNQNGLEQYFFFDLLFAPMVNYYKQERFPGCEEKVNLGVAFNARAMFNTGRLLSFGLQSGFYLISKDKFKSYDATELVKGYLYAVPLQVAISMRKRNYRLGITLGPNIMFTKIDDGNGNIATSHRFELSFSAYGNYLIVLTDKIFIGPELRIVYFGSRGITSFMPTLNINIKI